MRVLLLALALCACLDAGAAPLGLSTDKARTAAPTGGADLDGGPGAEGSSLAFMRADALLPIKGVLSVPHGGTGSSTAEGSSSYVALQGSSPGTAQTGNLNVSGDTHVGGAVLVNGMSLDLNGFCNTDVTSCWVPVASPTTSNLTAEAGLLVSGTSVSVAASGGDSQLVLAPGIATLDVVDGTLTLLSTVDGTTVIQSGNGGVLITAGATGGGTLALSAATFNYNGVLASGTGIPAVFGAYTSSADETGSIANTTLKATGTAPGAGMYRIAVYVMSNNTCATPGPGAVTVGMKWTDPTGVQKTIAAIPMDVNGSATLATSLPLGNTTGWANADFPVFANASTSIIFNTTMTACTVGTAKYRVYVGMDKPT